MLFMSHWSSGSALHQKERQERGEAFKAQFNIYCRRKRKKVVLSISHSANGVRIALKVPSKSTGLTFPKLHCESSSCTGNVSLLCAKSGSGVSAVRKQEFGPVFCQEDGCQVLKEWLFQWRKREREKKLCKRLWVTHCFLFFSPWKEELQ